MGGEGAAPVPAAGDRDRADGECWAVMAACKARDYEALLNMAEGGLAERPGGPYAAEYAEGRAELLLAAGRAREALVAAFEAAKRDRGRARGWLTMGDARLELGEHAEALECYGRAEGRAEGRDLAEALEGKARALAGMGKDEEFAEAAAAALALRPGDAGLAVLRSASLRLLGRDREAAAALDGARAGWWERPELDAERAMALAGAGDTAGALEASGRALARLPGHGHLWLVRARMLSRLGRREEALDALTVAVSLEPPCAGEAVDEDDLGPLRDSARFRRLVG